MNAQVSLLGLYQPGEGWLFRAGVGWKYLIMLALSIPALVLQQWPLTVSSLMATVLLLFSSGIGLVRALRIGWVMWLLLAALTAYHLVVLNPGAAVVQPGNLLLAILAARLLTLTTSTPELLSALASALRPLRFIGLKPDSIALMVALMIRSIPYLIGLFGDSQDAARPRAERNPVALLVPVVLGRGCSCGTHRRGSCCSWYWGTLTRFQQLRVCPLGPDRVFPWRKCRVQRKS